MGRIARLHRADLGEGGAVDGLVAGQHGRVRLRGRGTSLALAGLQHDQRLVRRAQPRRGVDKARAAAQALDVADHGAGLGIAGQVAEVVGVVQAGFVAGIDELVEAHVHLPAGGIDDGADIAALRQQADGAGAVLRRVGAEGGGKGGDGAGGQVGQPHAVGPGDGHAAFARKGGQRGLARDAGFAGLGKARRIEDGGPDAAGMAALQLRQHFVGAERQHRDVRHRRQGLHIGVAGQPGDLRIARIDRVNLPLVAEALQVVQRHAADAAGIARGADDGDRGGLKQLRQCGAASAYRWPRRVGNRHLCLHPSSAGRVTRFKRIGCAGTRVLASAVHIMHN
ncbi:hypothetical protein D9M68_449570 [compost metagenome]